MSVQTPNKVPADERSNMLRPRSSYTQPRAETTLHVQPWENGAVSMTYTNTAYASSVRPRYLLHYRMYCMDCKVLNTEPSNKDCLSGGYYLVTYSWPGIASVLVLRLNFTHRR